MSSSPSSHFAGRSRRRLIAWVVFGVVGLGTGAVWATGFASVTGANGATAASPAVTKTDAVTATSALVGTTTTVSPLAYAWTGRWGSIAADTMMFKVDLSGVAYAGKTYNAAVLLTNTSVLTGWASMQLEIERVDEAAGDPCVPADLDGTVNEKLLNFDDEDAGVYWNATAGDALAGDAVYCFGVAAAPGDDMLGTFLRSAQDTPPSAFPTFVITVDRAT